MTLTEAVRSGARHRDAVAVVTTTRAWRFGELFDAVEAFAGYLRRRHPPGESLVAHLADPFAAMVVTLGCDTTGTPVIHWDTTRPPVTSQALICDHRPDGDGRPFEATGVAGLVTAARTGPEPADALPAHSQTFLTSGSTGTPVGVVRSADGVLADADRVAQFLDYAPQTPIVVAAPLFHAYGFNYGLMAPLLSGASARYCPARSVPSQLARAARTHRAQTMIALPFHYTLLADVLRAGATADFGNLTRVVSAGGRLGPGVAGTISERSRFTLYNCYGSSEAGAVTLSPATGARPVHDVGEPLPGVSMRVDGDGSHSGELMLRSSSLALGRVAVGGPGTLSPLPIADGWYRTGDLAQPSTGNRILLAGRVDWVLNVAGKQVNPVEIEQVVAAHPGVVDLHVRAETDGTRGQVPVVQVVMRDGSAGPPLVEWCRQRLAPHQMPRRIEQVDSIARSATGKVVACTVAERL